MKIKDRKHNLSYPIPQFRSVGYAYDRKIKFFCQSVAIQKYKFEVRVLLCNFKIILTSF